MQGRTQLHPGCLQPMQVPPPMLSVESGGIYGTLKTTILSSLHSIPIHSCTIQQNFIIYTDNAAHIKLEHSCVYKPSAL